MRTVIPLLLLVMPYLWAEDYSALKVEQVATGRSGEGPVWSRRVYLPSAIFDKHDSPLRSRQG
jgi:hypothetical protein